MQSFISDTINDILKTTTSFKDVVFVLPSQRAKIFVKQTFKDKINVGFLPEILNVEQFINQISEVEKADSLQLLFYFYTVYKKTEKEPVAFDVFASWAVTVLQDFNEIDQHLVNTKDIFIYLRDIQRLRKWSVKGEFKETKLIQDHYFFLEKLNTYYTVLYSFLKEKNSGYQGLIYREACFKIDKYLNKNKNTKFFFIGFNALNKAEEFLFQKVLATGSSEIYWDIDTVFFNSNHQAGKFIRKYAQEWKYYEKKALKTIGNSFTNTKNITVIGAPKNTTQVKYAGEILSNFKDFTNTALVLADETLLPITLNSLPKNINAINITMGYPLKDVPTTSLLFTIFKLFISQEKLQKKETNQFYYKDVISFIKHKSIYKLLPNIDAFSTQVAEQNQTFINQEYLLSFFQEVDKKITQSIFSIFKPITSVGEFITRILNLIAVLKEEVTEIEKEQLFRFYTAFTQLKSLQEEYQYFPDLRTLAQFFRQLIASENLSFQGEPLRGLQLMGMLETRVLDFENIILISTNEGVLPVNSQQNSFIPFDVKLEFELPTYREKDAIFSYHFFRLLQRAKNVFIIYNTEHDVFGSGEKSRFVTQLEMMRTDITHKIISPKVLPQQIELKEIKKDNIIAETLRDLAKKGISPSALTNYLYNPVAFYKQKVLRIKEFDDVEETVAYNTLGTVVHETLDELYTPFVGCYLSLENIKWMETKSKDLITKHFKKEFKNGDITKGRNRLIFEVANRFVQNFLTQEKKLLKDENNRLKIIATEETLGVQLQVDELDFPVKIHGQVDRVDELNGILRIIDYKTGMVDSTNLKVTDFENLKEEKHHKAIQVLLYAYLYTESKQHNFKQPLEAGIYSFKNLNSGFLPVNFSANYRKPDVAINQERLTDFIDEIKKYIKEIYNDNVPFTEPADLKY
ncbi:PD-(D/E)XK nuclease family protein [Polaribacter sp. WD7]|uniref:PD-(D/E)XK nuclease family protein n=1 Tax=Polaribacter sp. WD7 TaxID=2269061 RepID=UPI000DF23F1D|nr:PD-(D/E)XK nuclease family protein [Polaribacter sp. WD7]RCS26195.1 PD-(D/E)XK nuclease family protein [Polaribacter sp. WD7]